MVLRSPRALGEEHCGGVCAPGWAAGGDCGEPAGVSGGVPGYQFVGEGRAVCAVLRRVQYSVDYVRGCAGVSAGDGAGVWRDYSAWGEAAVRVCRGDGSEDDGDHAEGVWGRLLRDGVEAYPDGCESGVADRGDCGDGGRG